MVDEFDKEILISIRMDMEQVYQEHREAEKMVHSMLKICVPVISFPIVSGALLISAKVLDVSKGISFLALPEVLAIICILTSLFVLLPLMSLVEHQTTEVFCKNAINDFRKLFHDLKEKCVEQTIREWSSMLPRDRNHPKVFRPLSSSHLSIILFGLISAIYMAAGVVSYDSSGPGNFVFVFIIWFAIQYCAYHAFLRFFK